MKSEMDGELTCGICLEFFDNPLMLPCSHNFCRKCLEGIINARSQMRRRQGAVSIDCPLCQRHITLEDGIDSALVNRTLENIVDYHKSKGAVPCSDASWNTDSIVVENTCKMHNLPMSFYCQSCSISVCKECACVSEQQNSSHRCHQIQELSNTLQVKISSALTEIKKKSIPLNDRVQLLEDILNGINENEKKIEKQLELEINALVVKIKSRQEEMGRLLSNDFKHLKRPIEEQLQRLKALQGTIEEHFKRLSMVKATKDTSLRVKLMQDSERQLNSLLCFDLAWFSSNDMPTVDMPSWTVVKDNVESSLDKLAWKKSAEMSSSNIQGPTVPVKVSTSRNINTDFGTFTNSFDSGEGDSEMAKQPIAPGLAFFFKNESAKSGQSSETQSNVNVRAEAQSKPISAQPDKTVKTQQNINLKPKPTPSVVASVSVSGFSGADNKASETAETNITFPPMLTSMDFVPQSTNASSVEDTEKHQGRKISKSSKTISVPSATGIDINLSMENPASFPESGSCVQKPPGGSLKVSVTPVVSSASEEPQTPLSAALGSLSVSDTVTSTTPNASLFTIGTSSSQGIVGTSSNFLFGPSNPLRMSTTGHDLTFPMPSVPRYNIRRASEGAIMRRQSSDPGEAPSNINTSYLNIKVNKAKANTAPINPRPRPMDTDSTPASISQPTVSSFTNIGQETGGNQTVNFNLPSYSVSIPSAYNVNVVTSSTASTVNSSIPRPSGSVSSNFPQLSSRDFSPTRGNGLGPKTTTYRRVVKPKKTLKK